MLCVDRSARARRKTAFVKVRRLGGVWEGDGVYGFCEGETSLEEDGRCFYSPLLHMEVHGPGSLLRHHTHLSPEIASLGRYAWQDES